MLEIASPSTGHIDANEKRDDYAALGITEYWRFDETGEHHGARLENGGYTSIPIAELATDILQGHSAVLNLNLRWEQGQQGLYIPASGRHIATFAGERAARIRAEAEAREERLARLQAQARIRELEDALRQLRNRLRKPYGLPGWGSRPICLRPRILRIAGSLPAIRSPCASALRGHCPCAAASVRV